MSGENSKKIPLCISTVDAFDGIQALGHILAWLLGGIAIQDFASAGVAESVRIESLKKNIMDWDHLSPDAKNCAFTIIETAEIGARESWEKYGDK